jgi:hypothetical protein
MVRVDALAGLEFGGAQRPSARARATRYLGAVTLREKIELTAVVRDSETDLTASCGLAAILDRSAGSVAASDRPPRMNSAAR